MKEKPIRIVQLNENVKSTSIPNRTRMGLQKEGISVTLLTAHSQVSAENVQEVKGSLGYKLLRKVDMLLKKIGYIFFYLDDISMPFSYDKVGINIAKCSCVQEADIIELHWICGSFLSVRSLRNLFALNKPIVWVCHDNWPFTGGCHVRLGCEGYRSSCGKCPQLQSNIQRDWSYRLLKSKKRAIRDAEITVVSPSTWMDKNVMQSSLFSECRHLVIPNPIDVTRFVPMKKDLLREKYHIEKDAIVILFGAVNAASTPYKGYSYLLDALDILEEKECGGKIIEAVVFGADDGDKREDEKIRIRYLGYLDEAGMAEAYNLADIYIVPSLEDSFNSTVAEALSCATPVVSFATGGITDIINHKENGYLAKYKDAEDLANGVEWVLTHNENNVLGNNGREKVKREYETSVVAKKYATLYRSLV